MVRAFLAYSGRIPLMKILMTLVMGGKVKNRNYCGEVNFLWGVNYTNKSKALNPWKYL